TSGFQRAEDLYNRPGPSYYPYSTVAPFSPETTSALNAKAARGMAGSPVTAAAQGYASDGLGGRYRDAGNPYLGARDQSIWNATPPRIDSLFSSAGRYGPNAAFGGSIGRAYADAIAPYHYNDYEAQLGRMDQMAALAPSLANADWTDIAAVEDVGAQRQAQAQKEIDAAQSRYN